MSCTSEPRFHPDEGVSSKTPLSLWSYTTFRLRDVVNVTQEYWSNKINCHTFSSSWVERNPDFPVSATGLQGQNQRDSHVVTLPRFPLLKHGFACIHMYPWWKVFCWMRYPLTAPPPPHPKKRARDQNKVTASGVDRAKNYLHMSWKFYGFARKTIVKWLRTEEIE